MNRDLHRALMAARARRPIVWVPLVLACLGAAAAAPVGTARRAFAIDPARSRATVAVGKTGAFSFAAGHTHEVVAPSITGTVAIDTDDLTHSAVRLDIDASKLTVTGKGDPPKDVPEVQRVMASDKVLDVARYPAILFQSTRVTVERRNGGTLDVIVTGTLTLHGVARAIAIPVHAVIEGEQLTADGWMRVKQTDHGITPVSVAGVVKVKDELDITFRIVARERGGN